MQKSFSYTYLVLPGDLHVTIAYRDNASDQEVAEMQKDLQRMIRPCLPFKLEFGNFCRVGANGDIPAYKVKVTDTTVQNLIKAYHKLHYRETPGNRMYPTLKLHVTVNTTQKLDFFENIMRQGNGYLLIQNAEVSSGSNKPAMAFYEQPPLQASAPFVQQQQQQRFANGDWWCQNCQFKIFASKSVCGKCKQKRP